MFDNLKLQTKLTAGFLFSIIPILVIGIVAIFGINKAFQPVKQEMPVIMQDISQKSRLDNLAQSIMYYDEVLTQAARNYSFTKDPKWANIYKSSVPELDKIIKEALESGDDVDKKYFRDIDASNLALIEMEEKALSLVDQNKADQAIKILESKEYWDQKGIYKRGLGEYVQRRSLEQEKSLESSVAFSSILIGRTQESIIHAIIFIIVIMILSFVVAILLGTYITNTITKRIFLLKDSAQKIAAGNLKERVKAMGQDEISELGESFNIMANKLAQTYQDLEKKIKERIKIVEHSEENIKKTLLRSEEINDLMVDRGLKMIELKKEISQLKGENKEQK